MRNLQYQPRKNIYDFILVFLLILNSGSMLNLLRISEKLVLIALFLWTALIYIKFRIPIIRKNFYESLTFYFGVLTLFFLQMLLLPNNLLSFQYITYSFHLLTIFLILYYCKLTNMDFANVLYKVLIVIMWYSVVSFLLWFPLKSLLVYVDVGGIGYDTLLYLFYYPLTSVGGPIVKWKTVELFGVQLFVRNMGFLWEPGILQIYMNLLLFLSINYFKNIKYSLLSILVILTTWSTTGIMIMFLQLAMFFVKNIKKRKIAKFLPILLMVGFFIGYILQHNLNEKLTGDRQGSAIQRQLDTLATSYLIMDHPFFGIGLDSRNYYNMLAKTNVSISGLGSQKRATVSNSLLYLFVFFGIPLGLFMLYAMYRQTLLPKSRNIVFVIIIISCMTEPVLLFPFFTFFMMNGFMSFVSSSGNEAGVRRRSKV